ncbi:restriction endonuclease [Rossellomorea aquimaris]|uniref:restriction endonuclease n=1 Tax=Rossellomorea aquimaris TaxID=189382 RepID=UPI001CFD1536|nr:restriction endonuclease [Rossellomorea aquimaris]
MGKRKYRKRSKSKSNIENMVLAVIIIYGLYKVILLKAQEISVKVSNKIENISPLDWLLIIVFITLVIVLIYVFRENINLNKNRALQQEAKYRISKKSEYEKLIKMRPAEFEKFVADLFTALGYEAELTPLTGDGGKDIILRKNNTMAIVECKRYNEKNKVSRPDIQKFHSALIDTNANEGFFVTTSYFTEPAMKYTVDKPIKLININRLMEMIEDVKRIAS